jgi:hypothetical protein
VKFALAIQRVRRLITKDSVTAMLRAPFTRFEQAAGDGEVNEAPLGTGLRKAVGELLTCPVCIAPWAATALVAGRLAALRLTSAAVSTFAVVTMSDHLQMVYGLLKDQQ